MNNENESLAVLGKIASPLKAIRAKCLDCSNQQIYEVKLCPVKRCALYPFRMGKNPFLCEYWDSLTDEEKRTVLEKLRTVHEAHIRRLEQLLATGDDELQ